MKQVQLLKMDCHPITGWKFVRDTPHTFEADKSKKVWRKKTYVNEKKAKEAKNESWQKKVLV